MSVGEFDSPWPAAVWAAAAAASDADAAGAVEDVAGVFEDVAGAVEEPAGPGDGAEPGDGAGPVEEAARGQCLAHSFGEAKLLRQRSKPRV